MPMKIAVTGLGYVGLSNAILLAQHNEVVALDIVEEKIKMINNKISPLKDKEIQEFLSTKELNLTATTDKGKAYSKADYIIISTPTDYNVEKKYFNTNSVETVIEDIININPNATIIVKSTVPVGYTKEIKARFNFDNIIFSPEFLREGKALYDNLYPSRIIIGEQSKRAEKIAGLLAQGAFKKEISILYMDSTEAEAVKLFSNAYLAMRVTYFNELDTYAETKGLDSKSIIEGVGLDPRIGAHYNNPSFGYGGYCLPKDTKQLMANYEGIPNKLITSIVDSNETRMEHIANAIIDKKPKVVGIYRLVMKAEADNIRDSAIQGVIEKLKNNNIEVVIYEPVIEEENFNGFKVIRDLNEFKAISDVIASNRLSKEIADVEEKVYTRDVYNRD